MPVGFSGMSRGSAAAAGRLDRKTVAYLDAMTDRLDDETNGNARVAEVDRFVRKVRDGGVWDKLGLLYGMYGHHEQADRLNMIAPGSNTLTKVNTPLFTAYGGWSDNGGAGYLDTGADLSAGLGGLFGRDDAVVGCHVISTGKSNNPIMGAGANTLLIACTTADVFRYRINQSANRDISSAISTPKGLSAITRTGSTATQANRNGTQIGTGAQASVAVTSNNLLFLTGTGSNFSGQTMTMGFAGKALTAADLLLLGNAWGELITARGGSPT